MLINVNVDKEKYIKKTYIQVIKNVPKIEIQCVEIKKIWIQGNIFALSLIELMSNESYCIEVRVHFRM